MSPVEVSIVPTGTANLASVIAGFRRVGVRASLARSAAEIDSAERVVLPGVGAFAAAKSALDEAEWTEPLRARVAADAPTLAICLGLQLLGTASEESPGVEGLGLVPCVAQRFPSTVEVPQLGWNRIVPDESARFLESGYAYFANTFRFREAPPGWSAAFGEHGGPFVAAIERGSVLACQFHPELSGELGRTLLQRWVAGVAAC